MSISYIWSITKLDCYPAYEEHTDAVFTAYWMLSGIEDIQTCSVSGSTGLVIEADAPFTLYADLTEEQIIDWVRAAMGAQQISDLENEVARGIENQKNPPVVNPPLPWLTAQSEKTILDKEDAMLAAKIVEGNEA